jgi:GH18 family chitinase
LCQQIISVTLTPLNASCCAEFYEKVAAYKAKGLKVLVAIGGWNDSAGDKYSRLVNSPGARARFISYVTDFIEKHNFDGLDLDWEYPKCWQVQSSALLRFELQRSMDDVSYDRQTDIVNILCYFLDSECDILVHLS